MLDDPTLARKLGKQAALDCRDWFDATKVVERTVGFYSAIIKSHEVRQEYLKSIKRANVVVEKKEEGIVAI